MTYAIDLTAQISATRELVNHVRRVAAALSLDDERARLLAHARELERHADEMAEASSPAH
jgi:hypothetical protein